MRRRDWSAFTTEHGYCAVVVRVIWFKDQDGHVCNAGRPVSVCFPDRLSVECLPGNLDFGITGKPYGLRAGR